MHGVQGVIPGAVLRSCAPGWTLRDLTEPADFSGWILAIAEHGDRAAFSELFDHFAPRVKAYLLRLGTNPETAEELAQETLLTVWRRSASFDPARAAASTWIFAIARNLRIDLARRERRPLPGEESLVTGEVPQPDALLEAAQDARRVAAALSILPDEQAEAIRLAFFSDKPHAEIALDLALPLGTVKSRIRLAMGRLRALLEDEG
jgi:RNA polymerase sigma-70 factor (ECF subfamily)